MSVTPKGSRRWSPVYDFKGAYDTTLQFFKDCKEHGIPVGLPVPTLYRAYLMDGSWPVVEGQDISRFLRFGKTGLSNHPSGDRTKQSIARLLATGVKAHYFLAPNGTMPQEPSVFTAPDLAQPGTLRHGLIYPLEIPATRGPGRQCSLVVAEWDLGLSAQREPRVPRGDEFPVVLLPDPYTWLSKKRWADLQNEASSRAQPWFEPTDSPARRRLVDAVNAVTDPSSFGYGTLLDYPIDIREDTTLTGAMWARGLRSWFLPHGFDAEAVKAYLDRVRDLSEADRRSLRWWERRREERSPRQSTQASTK
jgi:hypothetical protein